MLHAHRSQRSPGNFRSWHGNTVLKEKVGLWHLRVKRFTNYKSQPLKANVSLHLIFVEIGREEQFSALKEGVWCKQVREKHRKIEITEQDALFESFLLDMKRSKQTKDILLSLNGKDWMGNTHYDWAMTDTPQLLIIFIGVDPNRHEQYRQSYYLI